MSKRVIIVLVAVYACLMLIPCIASAVPANPFPVEIEQPDGTVIRLVQYGDENFSFQADTQGDVVVKTSGGTWKYVVANTDGSLAIGDAVPENVEYKFLAAGQSYITTGDMSDALKDGYTELAKAEGTLGADVSAGSDSDGASALPWIIAGACVLAAAIAAIVIILVKRRSRAA